MPIQYSGDIIAHNQSIFLIVYSHTQFIKMQNDASAWLLPHSVCSHFLHLFLFSSLSLSLIHFMTNAMNPIFKGKTHIQKRYSHVIYFTNSLDCVCVCVFLFDCNIFTRTHLEIMKNALSHGLFQSHLISNVLSLSLPTGMELK